MADEVVAASSPAVEVLSIPNPATAPKAYAEWRATGKIPEAKKADAPPADAPKAETSEAAPAGEAKTEGVTETPKNQGSKKDAEHRIKELLARTKELERRLEEGSKPKTEEAKQTVSPAKQPEPKSEMPKKPKLDDFKTYDEYEEAKDKYYEELADFKAEQRLQRFQQEEAKKAALKEFKTKLDNAKEIYGSDSEKVIDSTAKSIFESDKVNPGVKARITRSSVFPHLMFVLGGDATKLEAFLEKAETGKEPWEALDEITVLEQQIKNELGKPVKKETETPSKETKAPPPAHEVTAHSGPPPDEEERALKAGDMRAFKQARNRRDVAAFQGR